MGPELFAGEQMLAFLSSLQLADSFFPGGLYTLSHGLEMFVQDGRVDRETLEPLLCDYLRYSLGPADGVALACAHRAFEAGDLALAEQADRRLTAVKLPREARAASIRVGHQVLSISTLLVQSDLLQHYHERITRGDVPGNHAVVLGLTMAALAIPRETALAGELYAFTSNTIASAVRMTLIDHRMAQSILHRLKPVIVAVTTECHQKRVQDIGGCAPLIDVMAMRHERAEMRLFIS